MLDVDADGGVTPEELRPFRLWEARRKARKKQPTRRK